MSLNGTVSGSADSFADHVEFFRAVAGMLRNS